MPSPLVRKLENFTKLSDEQSRDIESAVTEVRDYGPREDIISHGDKPNHVHLMIDGWAGRYKLLPEGDRQIMAFLIPGDLCDVQVALLPAMDHAIAALSPCKVGFIPLPTISALMGRGDALSRALWWSTLMDEATLREWLVTLGRRPADKRVAHLICEMSLRCRAVGLSTDDSFEMPLNQEQLADTMGLSSVHVSRTLQELRNTGLISIERRHIVLKDLKGLMKFADFDPLYLHQQGGNA